LLQKLSTDIAESVIFIRNSSSSISFHLMSKR